MPKVVSSALSERESGYVGLGVSVNTVSSPTHMRRILMQKHVSSIDSVLENAATAKMD